MAKTAQTTSRANDNVAIDVPNVATESQIVVTKEYTLTNVKNDIQKAMTVIDENGNNLVKAYISLGNTINGAFIDLKPFGFKTIKSIREALEIDRTRSDRGLKFAKHAELIKDCTGVNEALRLITPPKTEEEKAKLEETKKANADAKDKKVPDAERLVRIIAEIAKLEDSAKNYHEIMEGMSKIMPMAIATFEAQAKKSA